jgi:hypothetical protein
LPDIFGDEHRYIRRCRSENVLKLISIWLGWQKMEKRAERNNAYPSGRLDEAVKALDNVSDVNLRELNSTLHRAIELSNESGLGMMLYLLSMAKCELKDVIQAQEMTSFNQEGSH